MATTSKKPATTPAASTIPARKPAASKPATTAKSAPQKSVKKNTATPEERYCMIATAAYFRAEHRGFVGGYEMEDWIAGEAQIDAKLGA
jgi:hypothetical protein